METTGEASDTLWSPARLREHEYLTLATDLALLKCMQNLSKRIATKSKSLIADIDSLERDTVSAVVQVENCVQNLNLISTKQFMEKRVYDEEDRATKEPAPTVQTAATNAAHIIPKIREGILCGLPVIKSQFSVLQNGVSASKSNLTPDRAKSYSHRPLPYILGSAEFINSKAVGVGSVFVGKSSSVFGDKEDVSVTGENTSVYLHGNLQVPQITNSQVPSDADSISSDASKATSKTEEAEANDITQGLVHVRSELEARLKIPAGEQPTLALVNGIEQIAAEAHPSALVVAKTELNQRVQPFTPPALTFTPPPIPKSKGLFDDSTSESDEESLFREKISTLPSPHASSVKSVSSSNPPDRVSERVASLPTQSNSDSVVVPKSDVLNNAKQIPPVTVKPTQSNYSASLSRDSTAHQTGSSTLENKKPPNLFFSSDSEDDFFSAPPSSKLQQPAHSKQSEPSVKSQTGYRASEKKLPNQTINQDIVDSRSSEDRAILDKGKSLFSDSESDDDLFAIVQSAAISKQTASLNKSEPKKSTFGYPIQSNSQPTLEKSSENLKGNKERDGRNELESNNEAARQAHSTVAKPIIHDEQKRSSFYSEDEDDDLFARVGVVKSQPSIDKLLVPNSTQKSTLQQPSHGEIINQPIAAPNVSSSNIKDEPEQSGTTIQKKAADPFPFKSPPPAAGLFYSDDESDDDLFKPSKETVTGSRKNVLDSTPKMDSYRSSEPPAVLSNSAEKEVPERNISESPNSSISNPVITTQESTDRVHDKYNGKISEPILQTSSSSSKLKGTRETSAASTRLFDDSDEDLFGTRPSVQTAASLSSTNESKTKSGPTKVEKNVSTVPAESYVKPVQRAKSYLANSLFDDSDDENLFGSTAKPTPSPRGSTLRKSESPALDRRAEISYTKSEAPQVPETKCAADGIPIETRSVSNFSSSSSHEPGFLSSDRPIEPVDVNAESGRFDLEMPPTADSHAAVSETTKVEVRCTQEPESPLSRVAQRTKEPEFQQPDALNKSASPVIQEKTSLSILESSDDDDLFGPREKSIALSKQVALERTAVLEAKDTLKEATFRGDLTRESRADVNTANRLSEQPAFINNEPLASDAPVEQIQTLPKLYANTPESETVNVGFARNNLPEVTRQPEEHSPFPEKKLMRPPIEESDEESDGLFKGTSQAFPATGKDVSVVLSGSSQESEKDASIQDAKEDRPSSHIVTTDSSLGKDASEVDGNRVAKVIETPIENVRAGRVAALRLSLAQQPNNLIFPSPDTQPDASSSNDSIPKSVLRKPFGGVPLFGPPIASSAKRRSPDDSAESSPSSPACAERPLPAKAPPDSVHEDATVGVVESATGANPDSLLCIGRMRPRLPSSRRPPTRDFRRSHIMESESESGGDDKPVTNEKLEAPVSSGDDYSSTAKLGPTNAEAPGRTIAKLSVSSKAKLFEDSDGSDDELFKAVSSTKKTQDIVPRASIHSEKLNQSKSFEEKMSNNAPKLPLGKGLPPTFLDDDSDDDLFAGPPKTRSKTTQITPLLAKNPNLTPTQDPLSRMSE